MKKSSLLYIVFAIMICGGVAGFMKSRQSGDTASAETVSAAELSTADYQGLQTVVIPAGTPSQEMEYEGFRLSFNKDNHTPNWVAWELLGTEAEGSVKRSNNFWTDSKVSGCAETSDYTRSGYDRGHMCPAADQKWSEQAMNDCFVMANMVPQDHSLNAGAWATLEEKERKWAQRDSAIVIIAGPLYEDADQTRIGSTGVRVPSACFKVLAAPYANPPRGIAFVYPNSTAPGNMENYVMTIRDVEKLTGYDFLSALPDSIEEMVETEASFKVWNKR